MRRRPRLLPGRCCGGESSQPPVSARSEAPFAGRVCPRVWISLQCRRWALGALCLSGISCRRHDNSCRGLDQTCRWLGAPCGRPEHPWQCRCGWCRKPFAAGAIGFAAGGKRGGSQRLEAAAARGLSAGAVASAGRARFCGGGAVEPGAERGRGRAGDGGIAGSTRPPGGRPAGLRQGSGPGRSSPSSHRAAAAEVMHEPAEAGVAPGDQGVRSLRHRGDLPCRAALSNLHEPAVSRALPVSPHLQHLFSAVGGKIWCAPRQPAGPQTNLPLPSLAPRR